MEEELFGFQIVSGLHGVLGQAICGVQVNGRELTRCRRGTKFSYDPTRDAAYEQYKNSYTRQAKLTNENAQANASAISGGYGSSYGTQAGQSAYQNAMAGLSSATNSLYSQALNQYTQKKSDLQSQLSGYQQAEAQDYEKYQTNYQNWENQRNYYQNAYNQAASESQAKKSRGTGLFGTILSVAASLLPFLL